METTQAVSAADVLAECDEIGVILTVHGGKVRFQPADAVDADLLERIKAAKPELLAVLAPPTARNVAREWTAAERDLLRWFKANRDRTPAAPFAIGPGRTVTDRDRFLAALDRDVNAGPGSARAVGLLDDLAALNRAASSWPPSGASDEPNRSTSTRPPPRPA